MPKFIFLLFVYFHCSVFCVAQKMVVHTNQQWLQYINQVKLSSKLALHSDASLRTRTSLGELSGLTLRTGLAYRIASNLQGVTGFACFTQFTNNELSRIEFRPYQEVNTSQSFGKVNLVHRFRIEGRFFNKVVDGSITSDDSFNYRFRYRAMCYIPIMTLSDTNPDRKLILNVGNEIFINAGKQIIYNVLDNNRLAFGLTLQTSKKFSITLTYISQFGQRNSPETYEYTDMLTLVFLHKMI